MFKTGFHAMRCVGQTSFRRIRISGSQRQMTTNKSIPPEAISIRKVTLKDERAVLDINNNVYFGQDFLPFFFKRLCQCQNTTCFAAVVENKLVGFIAETMVDNGDTVIARGLRINPAYQGLGIVRALGLNLLRHNKPVVFTHNDPDSMGAGLIFNTIQREYTKEVNSFEFYFDDVNFKLPKCVNPLTEVTPNHFNWIFQSKELTKYLFPMDRLVISWLPVKPLTSNIPLFFWHDEVMFTDLEVNSAYDNSNGLEGLLTSFSFFPVSSSQYVLNMDVFGKDTKTLDQHVLAHLSSLKKKVQTGKICLYICSEDGLFIKEKVNNLLYQHGVDLIKKSKQASYMQRMHVIKSNIKEHELRKSISERL